MHFAIGPNIRVAATIIPALAAIMALSGEALSQSYPSRPIRFIVPTPPAGVVDTTARALADRVKDRIGQPIVIENRPGAGGAIGIAAVAQAAPDGYTLLLSTSSFNVGPLLQKSFNVDGLKEITAIIMVSKSVNVLVGSKDSPFGNIKEYITYGRSNPGKINFGLPALSSKFTMSPLMKAMGVEVTYINYPGSAPIVPALLSGSVGATLASLAGVKGVLDGGRVIPLLQTGQSRAPQLPNVPAVSEIVPGYKYYDSAQGLWGPKGLPRPIVDRWNSEVNSLLKDQAFREVVSNVMLSIPLGGTPEEWQKHNEDEFHASRQAAEELGIKPE